MSGFDVLLLVFGITFSLALFFFFIFYMIKAGQKAYVEKSKSTQHIITDKELITLISENPGGFISIEALAKKSNLSKKEATSRLNFLSFYKVLTLSHSTKLKRYFSLREALQKGPYPKLSVHPFLSLNDLVLLFEHFDFKLTLQNICMATNLPVGVIYQEMEYFKKEKIVDQIGNLNHQTYVLNERYKNDPNLQKEDEEKINLDLSKIYQKHKL